MNNQKNVPVKPMKRFSFYHDPSIETMSRSVLKTLSYEAVILVLNFTAVYFVTGSVRIALGFAVISSVYTMLSYFIHDRIWDKIKWGKTEAE